MSDSSSKLAKIIAGNKPPGTPSLKNRLKFSILVIILPLFLLGGIGFFFFQKSTAAFNIAIEEVVSEVIPVTELKDKIQQTVLPFNRYLNHQELDDKEEFLKLSNEIKQSLVNPITLEHQSHSLANDIYHSAYLNWRNAHRTAIKIFNEENDHMSHYLLQSFYQYVIETTLALDKLHLAMQNRVKIRFKKAKELKIEALLLISFVFLLVYISTLATIIFLNRSILNPITQLEHWAATFSRSKDVKPLKLQSYQEFESIGTTYNMLAQMLHDDKAIMEEIAQKDDLTQLNNRRSFIARLFDEHNRHQRYNTRYSLMLIDVDHMGSVAQNYGEHVCDLTLIQISKMLEEAVRPTDFLARYHSDEFVIILPEVEVHGANITAERIRNNISEYVFKINGFKFGITVSIGFSTAEDSRTLAEVVQCTDFAVQQAKLTGRNQVQYCDPDTKRSPVFDNKYLNIKDFNPN